VHEPVACAGCGLSLADAPVVSTEARQVFDVPQIVLRVIEHRLEHRACRCGQVTMAQVPAGVGAPTQYGPGVRALGTYLLAGQYLPLARTAELLTELVGAPISAGSLACWYTGAADALDSFDQVVRDGLARAPVLGADETGIRLDGALAWVHAARTEDLTRYTVSPRRGVEAMTAAGVLPALAKDTVLVSDFWAPYWSFDVLHAVCGAHLGRELVAAAEVPGQAGWAEAMDRLLVEINRTTAGPATPARTLWPPRCWAATGAATTSWSRPAGRPTLNTVPGSAGNGADPNTSTCSTAWTPTATRCCATARTCESRSRTTVPSKMSAP